jgi:hypothetical protein
MDKKEAEQEALRKAKETQNAAGKNVGMSGRDLVSWVPLPHHDGCLNFFSVPIQSRVVPGRGRRGVGRLGSCSIQTAEGRGRPGCRARTDCDIWIAGFGWLLTATTSYIAFLIFITHLVLHASFRRNTTFYILCDEIVEIIALVKELIKK